VVEFLDEALCFVKAALLFSCVFGFMLVERVLECWEGSLRPVEGGDIKFMDGL